ncbi:MAG: trehalose 6-phosphate phosphatase [Actinomycetota bacterium]|jgi:trehalose 6-phosphate phosphatase|nr:trehalose 6-phosphate phosphatase [Actinomycetota bacterium]
MATALERFRASPSTSGVFADFDGTLSEIAHLPHDARPIEGAVDLLNELGRKLGLVAIVSGRSAVQLAEWLGPSVEIWGTHGAEYAHGGSISLTEQAARYEELMGRVRDEAAILLNGLNIEGVLIEDKRVMIGLHFRAAADVEHARTELDRIAQDLADRHGLIRAGGRLAFELRPPEEFSKAAVVLQRAREVGLKAAMFIGDDRVDLPGFDALDVLADEGLATLRVAVDSDEVPPELIERADIVVEHPRAALEFLRGLLKD